MGMFDNYEVFSEHFEEGQPFILTAAKVGDTMQTEYGPAVRVLLAIRTPEGDKWYSTFGQALVAQIGRLDGGDLPTKVTMERVTTKDGKRGYKSLIPVDPDKGKSPKYDPTAPGEDVPF